MKITTLIKPTTPKIILFLIFVLFLPVSYSSIPDLCGGDSMVACATTHFTTMYGLLRIFTGNTQFVAFYFTDMLILIASLVVGYLIACLLVDTFRKKQL